MAPKTTVILGCGYTGRRVAQRILARGGRVIGTSRNPASLEDIEGLECVAWEAGPESSLRFVPQDSRVLYSIPPVDGQDPSRMVRGLGSRPARVVYLSTTGVYGDQKEVDANSSPAPRHPRDEMRLAAEAAVFAGPWSAMVLRPAAIYGTDRGIHVSMAEGRFRLVDGGTNYVSRIHVDDLAAHAEAALFSDLEGAWPVADDAPCTSREIAEYCAKLMGLPMPASIGGDEAHHTRRADRRVDGRAVRELLGLTLRYPSYREGILFHK